jgi:hypothetical protein
VQELLLRVRAMMLTPRAEWPAVASESNDTLALRYIAVLALIPTLARLVGGWLIGGYTPFVPALVGAVVGYALSFVSVFAVALAIDLMAPNFDAARGYSQAFRLAAYSFTPVWLAGIVLLVPGTSFLALLGLYGIYLLWTGLPVLMRAPGKTIFPYLIAAAACAIAIDVAARVAMTAVTGAVR